MTNQPAAVTVPGWKPDCNYPRCGCTVNLHSGVGCKGSAPAAATVPQKYTGSAAHLAPGARVIGPNRQDLGPAD